MDAETRLLVEDLTKDLSRHSKFTGAYLHDTNFLLERANNWLAKHPVSEPPIEISPIVWTLISRRTAHLEHLSKLIGPNGSIAARRGGSPSSANQTKGDQG